MLIKSIKRCHYGILVLFEEYMIMRSYIGYSPYPSVFLFGSAGYMYDALRLHV